jgi:predicted DNA-binding protein with PD1-like motif
LPTSTTFKELSLRAELTMGRTFAVHFDHGDNFNQALGDFCEEYGVRQGFIPMFIVGMREVELVGVVSGFADQKSSATSSVLVAPSYRWKD